MRSAALVVLALALAASAVAEPLPEEVRALMAKHRVKPDSAGIWIQRAGDSVPVVAHNADTPLNPASVIKVVTGWAAVERHGAKRLFRTQLRHSGEVKDGVLDGDLYFTGGGDPHITVDNLLHLLNQLRDGGLRVINGDLVIDDSYFDLPPYDPFDFDGAGRQPYNAEASAAAVNFEAQRVEVSSDKKQTRAQTSPPNDNFVVISELRLMPRRCRWPGRAREHYSGDGASDEPVTLTIKGIYGRNCKNIFTVRPLNPAAHAAGVITALWRRLGGELRGGWRRGKTPPQSKLLADMHSLRVPQLIYAMNKHSSNLIARHLFLSLGEGGPPYQLPKAQRAVMNQLSKAGINTNGWHIANGSGLSRETRVTARGLGGVLSAAWSHPMRAEIVASLPILGVDGTLKKRLRRQPYRRRAHLKTGGLKGVRSLAGFVRAADGGDVFFVSIINQRGGAMKNFEDALIKWAHTNATK